MEGDKGWHFGSRNTSRNLREARMKLGTWEKISFRETSTLAAPDPESAPPTDATTRMARYSIL